MPAKPTPAPDKPEVVAPEVAPVETELERVNRETREHEELNAPKLNPGSPSGDREKFNERIAGLEKELARYVEATKDGNPRKVGIADLNRQLRHFKQMRDALTTATTP